MDRYRAYDPFADTYARRWGGFASGLVPVLDRLGLAGVPDGSRLLDLCCGAGHLAALLSDRYEVIGVDGSAAMIDHAARNAPGARFVVADARDFQLDHPVAAVVSTYDSLNHVLSLDELATVFANVAACLVDGGLLLFDLNMEDGFLSRWQGSFTLVEDDEVLIGRSSYDEEAALARLDLTIFRPDPEPGGRWTRDDIPFSQRAHPESGLRAALDRAGFAPVEMTPATALGIADEGRSFFVARRRARV